jgi:peptidoglycan/LPS O-acetylase OafA/YrhL
MSFLVSQTLYSAGDFCKSLPRLFFRLQKGILHLSNRDSDAQDRNEQPTGAKYRFTYIPELDGLRGISILLVFIHHIYFTILPGGFLGVDIFFVLSGFLITSLLLREWDQSGSLNLKHFYIRRALRLMPALITLVLILGAYAFIFLDPLTAAKTYQGIWLTLSYVSNWIYAVGLRSADNPLGITWSLAIEEQFYLLWPFVLGLALLSKRFSHTGFLTILGLSTVLAALNRSLILEENAIMRRVYYPSHTRADALLIGCMIAFVMAHHAITRQKVFRVLIRILAVPAAVFLLLMAVFADWTYLLLFHGCMFTLIDVSAGIILTFVLVRPPRAVTSLLSFGPLVWVGRVSYGLYLWHWAVRWFVYHQEALPRTKGELITAIVLSFGLTVFSYYVVELAFLRWKTRFHSVRRPDAGTTTSIQTHNPTIHLLDP